jgi:hypothetical protein
MRANHPLLTLALALSAACGQGEITLDPNDPNAPGNPDIRVSGVAIEPETAYTDTTLRAVASADAPNPARLTWRYVWLIDGQTTQDGPSDTLDAAQHRRDQRVAVRVTASDGSWPSTAVTSPEIAIRNTPPTMRSVQLSPTEATAATQLRCDGDGYFDLDGDEVRPRFTWWVNGESIPLDSATFGPGAYRRDDVVGCSAAPTDGTDDGPRVESATVKIGNSPPQVDTVRIAPNPAFTTSTLTAEVVGRDLDGDAVTYSWRWTVNGAEAGATSALPSSATRRGDQVQVQVVGTDGIARSEPVSSAIVTISNSVPTAPGVAIAPEAPRKGQALLCDVVVPSTDGDGDRLTYVIDWYRDGALYTGATETTVHDGDTLPGSATRVGEVWTCAAQAWDRIDTSPRSERSEGAVIGEGIWVFDIREGDLINQPWACWGAAERYTCSGGYGFAWVDEADIAPASVDVEYNHGWNCGSVGTRTASITGTAVGTARTGDAYNCGCRGGMPAWVKSGSYRPPSSYVIGGRNTFTMTAASCEGFSPYADWALDDGTAIFARVTVRY